MRTSVPRGQGRAPFADPPAVPPRIPSRLSSEPVPAAAPDLGPEGGVPGRGPACPHGDAADQAVAPHGRRGGEGVQGVWTGLGIGLAYWAKPLLRPAVGPRGSTLSKAYSGHRCLSSISVTIRARLATHVAPQVPSPSVLCPVLSLSPVPLGPTAHSISTSPPPPPPRFTRRERSSEGRGIRPC